MNVRAGGSAAAGVCGDRAVADGRECGAGWDEATGLLRERFGLNDFRHGQRAVIERLLAGRSVAAIFPTGGGKSLCYQLPSQLLSGLTVVVSPLIALMKDQCDALAARGIAAARLDSRLSPADYRESMTGIREGRIKLLYASPERFFNERFIAAMGTLPISLLAIDEAHCISQWGHNFRPDYLKLAKLAEDLSVERVLALTATATPSVLDDIREAFGIEANDAIRTPFHRRNLQLRSTVVTSGTQHATLLERIRDRPRGPTLVYVSLQRTAEEVAGALSADGLPAEAYHAGMDGDVRNEIQQRFIASGDAIVVATIAFGMGIDKPDLRYVYHYNPPKSLEAYAQEIGRAGRDGEDAICEMLLLPEDRTVLENFTYGDTPSRHAVGRLVHLLVNQPDEFHVSHYGLSGDADIRILVVRTLLTYLELDGYLQATAPRYDTYKVQPHVTSETILDHFSGQRRQFVAGVLGSLSKGRRWFLLDMAAAAKRLQAPRTRIIKALDYLAERGWVEVQASGLVHGYRWIHRVAEPKLLADDLFQRLHEREHSEIGRLDDVFELAAAGLCQAQRLSAHFGETLDQPCGCCTWCRGEGPRMIPEPGSRKVGTAARSAVSALARRYPDHFATPRDRARFLCGLSSPGFVRAKLTRDPNYGVCDRVPFADVLAQVGGE